MVPEAGGGVTHLVGGDRLREGPRSGRVPFSARKSADFPSNHGLLFRATTSLFKQVVFNLLPTLRLNFVVTSRALRQA